MKSSHPMYEIDPSTGMTHAEIAKMVASEERWSKAKKDIKEAVIADWQSLETKGQRARFLLGALGVAATYATSSDHQSQLAHTP